MNFIHKFFKSKKCEKSLEEYERLSTQKYYLSLFNESSDHEGHIDFSKIKDVDDPNNIPLLNVIFTNGLWIIHLIDIEIESYNSSDFEVKEAAKSDKWLFIFRIWAICILITRELKNIRIKSNEVYNKLDDWIVDYTKNENMNVNEVISKIRETIDGNKTLDTDIRISSSDIQDDDEDVKFIETVFDKSFIQSGGQTYFSFDWAYDYTTIFQKITRNEYIKSQYNKYFSN